MTVIFVRVINIVLPLFISAVLLDSFRHKISNSPYIQTVFGTLNEWASDIELPGLFAQSGVFSQYVIGISEFMAVICLIFGFIPGWKRLQVLGAAIAFCIMSVAINLHLFTPLGIDPLEDGGGLFLAVCMIWLFSVALMIANRKDFAELFSGLAQAFVPKKKV